MSTFEFPSDEERKVSERASIGKFLYTYRDLFSFHKVIISIFMFDDFVVPFSKLISHEFPSFEKLQVKTQRKEIELPC